MEEQWESELSENSIKRYTRQIIVPNIGIDGQKRIEDTKILIVGLGGLGSPVLAYIGMAGVNQIGVVDFDRVELHNLQRQLAHTESRIGMTKVQSAVMFLNALNSAVKIIPHNVLMDETNCLDIISNYDLVIDCCDQIGLRYAIADACRDLGKNMVNGSVLRWGGQICVFPSGGRCFRCVFPEMKSERQNCDESGVIGSMCGVVGSMQATEAIKMAIGRVRTPNMIIFNGYNNSYKCFELNCKPCKLCSKLLKGNENDKDKKGNENDKDKKVNENDKDKEVNENDKDKKVNENDKDKKVNENDKDKKVNENDKDKKGNENDKDNNRTNMSIEDNNKSNNSITTNMSIEDNNKSNNSITTNKNIIDSCNKKTSSKHNVITWRRILENPIQFKIYDIRSKLHFEMFRVKNSINIPNGVDNLVYNGPETIVISCYRGISSVKAVELLRKKGIEAFSAENGIEGFKREIKF